MSTDVDAVPPAQRSGRRGRYLALAAVLLVTAGLTVTVQRLAGNDGPGDLPAQLAARMIKVLEQTPPERHQGHGADLDELTGDDPEVLCAVRVFGYEPATAATLEQVDTVYGHHLCALAEPGRDWDFAVKLVGPLVLRLAADPPTVQVAEAVEGVSFRERVRQLIPERYQQQAYQESLDAADFQRLRQRYDDVAGD